MGFIFLSTSVWAETIVDIPGNEDSAKPLTRREMTLAIDKLEAKIDNQELMQLSKSFKHYLAAHETSVSAIEKTLEKLDSEHKSLQIAFAQQADALTTLKEENNTQHLYMISGGVALGLLALFVK